MLEVGRQERRVVSERGRVQARPRGHARLSFEAFYEEHLSLAVAVSAALCRDVAVAEEITQVATLRRRHVARIAARWLAIAVGLVAMLVVAPQILPIPRGVTIGPISPSQTLPPDASGREVGVEVRTLEVADPVPLEVLAVRFNNPSVAVVDLDRGDVAVYPPGVHRLPGDAIDGGAMLSDGTVVVWQDGTVRAFRHGLDQAPLKHTPDELINPPDAAPSLRVVPTADGKALWVVQIGAGCCPTEIAGRAELVELDTGRVAVVTELPPSSFPVASTVDGLLLNTLRWVDTGDGWVDEPGSHRTLLLDTNGTVIELWPGEVLAASGTTAAVITCADHEPRRDCEFDLVDVATAQRRRVDAPVEGTWTAVTGPNVPTDTPPWTAATGDGRLLIGLEVRLGLQSQPTESHLVTIDPTDASVTVVRRFEGPIGPAAWDRGGQYVVVADGPDLVVVDPADGASFTVRDAIPADHYLIGMG